MASYFQYDSVFHAQFYHRKNVYLAIAESKACQETSD
jgi:hypothetical protein